FFGPLIGDPFAAEFRAPPVSGHKTGIQYPDSGRISLVASLFRGPDSAPHFSATDSRPAARADAPQPGGTDTFSIDTALFGDPFTIPAFGSVKPRGASAGAVPEQGGNRPGGGGGGSSGGAGGGGSSGGGGSGGGSASGASHGPEAPADWSN